PARPDQVLVRRAEMPMVTPERLERIDQLTSAGMRRHFVPEAPPVGADGQVDHFRSELPDVLRQAPELLVDPQCVAILEAGADLCIEVLAALAKVSAPPVQETG